MIGWKIRTLALSFFLLLISLLNGQAAVHYVNASHQNSDTENGTKQAPWRNLNSLLKSGKIQSGDELYLFSGDYGMLVIRNTVFSKLVKIDVIKGQEARFSSVIIKNSSNIELSGLVVSSSFSEKKPRRQLVEVSGRSKNIVIRNFEIFSVLDSTSWSVDDWNEKAVSGISVSGEKISILGNRLRNVNHGIISRAEYSVVRGNIVDGFSGDGMRGLASFSIFTENVVKNCVIVNKNHDDGFQSWTIGSNGRPGGGILEGVILTRNLFLARDKLEEMSKCNMHGIGMFGGVYRDWRIENNIVVINHWHGITLLGAQNVKVLNNTVVDINGKKPGPAWIKIDDFKKVYKSSGNVVANNLAHSYGLPTKGVLALQNQIIRNPKSLFVDPENFDFRLKLGSRAIDAGRDDLRVSQDFYGNPRPSGGKTDVGAVETQK